MDEKQSAFPQHYSPVWRNLSPRNLEHRVYLPTAITFHRLAPATQRSYKNHSKLASHPYKHLDPEEIARAQAKARHVLLKARLSKEEHDEAVPPTFNKIDSKGCSKKENKKISTTHDKQSESSLVVDKTKKKNKLNEDNDSSKQPSSRPKLPIYRGMGESSLRVKQIIRHSGMIVDCIQDLHSLLHKPILKKDFVLPHETEIKKKRWNDFMHSSGRMFFALKREVISMERSVKAEERNDKTLRMLASSTRTLLKLLLALKTYSEVALQSTQGKKLFNELIATSHRVHDLISALGISLPKQKMKAPSNMMETESEDSSIDSLVLDSSDVCATNLKILQPDYLRSKLSEMASAKLQKKRRKKRRSDVSTTVNGKRQEKPKVQEKPKIILAPLKQPGNVKISNDFLDGHPGVRIQSQESSSHDRKVTFNREPLQNRKGNEEVPSSSPSHVGIQKDTAETRHTLINGTRPQGPTVSCKLQDQNRLVEETANAVVNRLMPLMKQDTQGQNEAESVKTHRDTSSSEAQLPDDSEKQASLRNINNQIDYLLERFCRIEAERKQSIEVVMEVSRKIGKEAVHPETTLQLVMSQARGALNDLAEKEKHITGFDPKIKFPITSINVYNSSGGNLKFNKDVPKPLIRKENYSSDDEFSNAQDSYVEPEILTTPHAENIADQVMLQKEEFWSSLVDRGYLKPAAAASDGKTAATAAVELLLRETYAREAIIGKENTTETRLDTDVCQAKLKASSLLTDMKREVPKVDKGTLVTSLMSSYSSSFETGTDSAEQISNRCDAVDKTSDERSSQSKVTSSENNGEGTSSHSKLSSGKISSYISGRSDNDHSEESQYTTFPSYSGSSSNEKDK